MTKTAKAAESLTSIHLTLQSKGGVGKSLCTAFLAQYFSRIEGCTVRCIDTDPNNQTFTGYTGLDVTHCNLLDGAKINEREFDKLMERFLTEDGVFVVDNGSTSFLPLSNYLLENDALSMLRDAGREVFIHTILTGGQALKDTVGCFDDLAQKMAPDNSMVVWLNEFFGPIEHVVDESNRKTFVEMKAYTRNVEKVRGIVRIPKRNQDTFGRDIESMATQRLTFKQIQDGSNFSIMARQRLKTVERDLFGQLDEVGF
jgi:hypothetical protein